MLLEIKKTIEKPTSIAPLVVFRMIFGLLMLISTIRFMYLGWVEEHFINSVFFFKYYGFEWVKPLNAFSMYAIHYLMIAAALGITIGFLYRFSAFIFFLCFTYCQLIDISYYLNHYYFVSLMSLILVILPANYYFSIDNYLGWVKTKTQIPLWCILLIKFQLGIVYFYAGIAKIQPEWLFDAMPLRLWLPAQDDFPLIGFIFTYPLTAYIFSWAGMLYDIFIVLLLSWSKTRLLAYGAVIFFHALTGYFFQIGVFPIVMIFSTLIFFSDNFHIKIIHFLEKNLIKTTKSTIFRTNDDSVLLWNFDTVGKKILAYTLIFYVVFQLLFPFRYLLYPGDLFWTEQGFRFSWRVMLMEKAGTATFFVKDGISGAEGEIDNKAFLTTHQEKQMAFQPDLILQYAHFLKKYYEEKGMKNVSVRAQVYVTLNGSLSKLYFDPTLDLTKIQDSWQHKAWLYPRCPQFQKTNNLKEKN
jgi:hypothetical protein